MPAEYPATPVLDSRSGPDPKVEQPCDGTLLTHSSRVVGPFLDWLEGQGIILAKWGEDEDDPDEPALYPIHKGFSTILHDYYGIDPNAEEAERQAILAYIRRPRDCNASFMAGASCELPEGHEGEHWTSHP